MSHYVNLEIRYSTYLNLCNAVEETATHAEDFNEIQELVHLVDFLEDEYERDRARQNLISKPGNCMRNFSKIKKYIIINIFIRSAKY